MSATGNFMEAAIETSKQAVEADNAGNAAEAIHRYARAVECLRMAQLREAHPARTEVLKGMADKYKDRIAQLVQLAQSRAPPELANPAGTAPQAPTPAAAVDRRARVRPRPRGDAPVDAQPPPPSNQPPHATQQPPPGQYQPQTETNAQTNGRRPEEDEAAKLRGMLDSAVVRDSPAVSWDDVAGLDVAKSALQEAAEFPRVFPQLFTGKRRPWTGILLYGPPGTGKSYLAKALATATRSKFFAISSSDLVSKWVGESEKLVKHLFQLARESQPSIVFIDEIDSVCGARTDSEHDTTRRIKTELMVQMNGVTTRGGVLVLAATNTPWSLDPAVRRRLEKRIYVPLPDAGARLLMLRLHLGADTPHALADADFGELARALEGFSGADIEVLVRDALMEPVRRVREATHFAEDGEGLLFACSPGHAGAREIAWRDIDAARLRTPPITRADFDAAAARIKPSVGAADITRHVSFTAEFGQET
jgi:vacuolar protein-sorting-associated protein 4